MNLLREVYLTVFVLFFRLGQNSWSQASNVAKGVAGITWLQFMILIGAIAWLYFFTGNKVLLAIPRLAFVISFGLVAAINYYTLVTCQRGTRFEKEFKTLEHRQRSLLLAGGLAFILFSFGFALISASYVHAHGPLHP